MIMSDHSSIHAFTMTLPHMQLYGSIMYRDVRECYHSLPDCKRINADRWSRRLAHLGIPIAVCRLTQVGDISVLVWGRCARSVWVPIKLWDAVLANRVICRDDVPAVPDLVRKDGFVNLNKLCSLTLKRVDHVKHSPAFERFSSALGADMDKQVIYEEGYTNPTTWVHPRLADFVAFRGSMEYAIAATAWMDAAREQVKGVAQEHIDILQRICTGELVRDPLEATIRDRLSTLLCGQVEVTTETSAGILRSDIVTGCEVIEVKHVRGLTCAAHAIGQVGLYHKHFQDKSKRVHLFGKAAAIEQCRSSCELESFSHDSNVTMTFEVVEM